MNKMLAMDDGVRQTALHIGWRACHKLCTRLRSLGSARYSQTFVETLLGAYALRVEVLRTQILPQLGLYPVAGFYMIPEDLADSMWDALYSIPNNDSELIQKLSAAYSAHALSGEQKTAILRYMLDNVDTTRHTTLLDVLNDWRQGTMAVSAVLNLQGFSCRESLKVLPSEEKVVAIIDRVLGPQIDNLTVVLKMDTKKTKISFCKSAGIIDKPSAAAALLELHFPGIATQIVTILLVEMQADHLRRISERPKPGSSILSLYSTEIFKYVILRVLDENTEVLLTPPAKQDNMLAPLLTKWGVEDRKIIVKTTTPCAIYYRDPTLETLQYKRLDSFKEWYQTNANRGLGDIILKTPEVRDGINDEKCIAGTISFGKLESLCIECYSARCDNVEEYLPIFSNDSTEACMCHFPTREYLSRSTHSSEPDVGEDLSEDYSTWGEGPLLRMGVYQRAFMAWVWKLFDAKDNSRQALFISGSGMDGKSVIASVLKTVMGGQVAAVWDTDTTSDFVKQSLVGKRLLCAPDLKGVKKFLQSTLFHQVTGQDVVSFNVKNKDFSTGTFKGSKVLLLSNEKLDTNGQKSIETRILWIPIAPRDVLIEDPTFESRLLEQFPAFLRACEGASKDPEIVDSETGMIKQEALSDRCQTAEDTIAQMLFAHYSDALCDGPLSLLVLESDVRKAATRVASSVIAGRYRDSIKNAPNATTRTDPAGFNVYSVRAKLDNMISNARWLYNKGEISLPENLRAGYLAQRTAPTTTTTTSPKPKEVPMEEEIDLDKLVSGAMNQTEATELSLD